jgi:hypothetical protein
MSKENSVQEFLHFDISQLKAMYSDCPTRLEDGTDGVKRVRDISKCKQYVLPRVFTLKNGDYAVFEENNLVMYGDKVMRKLYISRFPKEVKEWFLTDDVPFYDVVVKPNSPKVHGNTINLLEPMKAEVQDYDSFSNDTKELTKRMLHHVKSVWCNNKKDQYNYMLKYFKCIFMGKKNSACVYLRGAEGLGKSIVLEFIGKHVAGNNAICKGTSKQLIGGFNISMLAKRIVIFEELPTFSTQQWMGVSGVLKDHITGTETVYEDKYKSSFECNNVHSIFIVTNVSAIKDDNGRRYFILDCSTEYRGDNLYFEKLAECFSDDVGNCFYNYIMENVEVPDKWNAQSAMPLTDNKKDSYVERMQDEYRFLKEHFILNNISICKKLQQLYLEYETFMSTNRKQIISKIEFNKKLKEIGINSYTSGGYQKVKISAEALKEIAEKNHWLHELDEPEIKEPESDDDDDKPVKTKSDHLEEENQKLREEIERLTKALSKKEEEQPKKKAVKTNKSKREYDLTEIFSKNLWTGDDDEFEKEENETFKSKREPDLIEIFSENLWTGDDDEFEKEENETFNKETHEVQQEETVDMDELDKTILTLRFN